MIKCDFLYFFRSWRVSKHFKRKPPFNRWFFPNLLHFSRIRCQNNTDQNGERLCFILTYQTRNQRTDQGFINVESRHMEVTNHWKGKTNHWLDQKCPDILVQGNAEGALNLKSQLAACDIKMMSRRNVRTFPERSRTLTSLLLNSCVALNWVALVLQHYFSDCQCFLVSVSAVPHYESQALVIHKIWNPKGLFQI